MTRSRHPRAVRTIPAGALLILLASVLVVTPAGGAPSPAAEHPAVFRNGTWFLRPALSSGPSTAFTFGRAGDRPVMGDWDGDGDDTPGVFRDGVWYYRNAISASVVHSFR